MSTFVYTARRCENWSESCQPYENYLYIIHTAACAEKKFGTCDYSGLLCLYKYIQVKA